MLITIAEYYDMGFTAASDTAAESCIKRAGFIIGHLTDGRAAAALAEGGERAALIKQAVGFQAQQLAAAQAKNQSTEESVTLGDFSYRQKSGEGDSVSPADDSSNVIGLLRSAGVLFKGVRVRGY